MTEKTYEIIVDLDGRDIDEIFSSGLAYYICPLNHEVIQYFINMVFVTIPCTNCGERAILDRTEKFP